MNARQTKKCLKKQIRKLKADNDLMRRIIADSPSMRETYDLWNKPLEVKQTMTEFKEFKAQRPISAYVAGDKEYVGYVELTGTDVERCIEYTKKIVTEELFEAVKENITYEVNTDSIRPTVTASIFIGRERSARTDI